MNNTIKTITILVVVMFVFSVYPMEVEAPNRYFIQTFMLKRTNPLLQMDNFYTPTNRGSSKPTPKNDPIYKDRGLALSLTAVRLLTTLNEVKNKETLETIYDAARQGIPITSQYNFKPKGNHSILPFNSEQNPISIFSLVDELFKFLSSSAPNKVNTKRLWIDAIYRGEQEREKILIRICNKSIIHINSKLTINVPKDIMLLIFSFLLKGNDEERTAIIKNAIMPPQTGPYNL